MNVVVDTSLWSLYLRHKNRREPEIAMLKRLIAEGRVQMLGVIRQELLSGIKELEQFEKLRRVLGGFPSLLADDQDHLVAAQYYNTCRAKGVQGSSIDFLICAQAVNYALPILTTDKDFKSYAKFLPIKFFN
jgi:predicted nucleic acid-binding protein